MIILPRLFHQIHIPCVSGVEGVVEIESQWTARKRERLGILPQITREIKTPALPDKARQGRGTRTNEVGTREPGLEG